VIGVNEYLTALGVNYQFESEDAYKEKLNYLAHRMFECITAEDRALLEEEPSAIAEEIIGNAPDAPMKPVMAISRLNASNSIPEPGSPSVFPPPRKNTAEPLVPPTRLFASPANI
jgi:hypothetical protein